LRTFKVPSSTPKGHTPWENVGEAMNLNCAIVQSDFMTDSSVPRRTIQDTNCPYDCVTTFWSLLLEEDILMWHKNCLQHNYGQINVDAGHTQKT